MCIDFGLLRQSETRSPDLYFSGASQSLARRKMKIVRERLATILSTGYGLREERDVPQRFVYGGKLEPNTPDSLACVEGCLHSWQIVASKVPL
jgi:hypothetical protein